MPAMNLSLLARSALLGVVAAGLTACGGGHDNEPMVTTLQASPTMYGHNTTVTVQGGNLSAITATIEPGCGSMTRGTTGSDSVQTFSCKISAMGDLRVRVRNEAGAELASLRLDVGVPQVLIAASQGSATGSFTVELDPAKAPKTVDNFLAYVNQSGGCFYKDTLFHRVIANFVVQAGGYTTGLAAKTTGKLAPIALESNNGLSNVRGTIAMARTNDPNSATSEFFVNVKDNLDLDYQSDAKPGYAVFGKVVAGMADIDRLQTVPTQTKTNGLGVTFNDAPQAEVVITTCGQVK